MISNKRVPEIDGLRVDEAHKGGGSASKAFQRSLPGQSSKGWTDALGYSLDPAGLVHSAKDPWIAKQQTKVDMFSIGERGRQMQAAANAQAAAQQAQAEEAARIQREAIAAQQAAEAARLAEIQKENERIRKAQEKAEKLAAEREAAQKAQASERKQRMRRNVTLYGSQKGVTGESEKSLLG